MSGWDSMKRDHGMQTIDLQPLDLRAAVSSANDETRTVELTFSTGAAVERFDWMTGKRFMEKLSLVSGHVRLGRLNEGAPLLDSHSAFSVTHLLGAVVQGSARVESKKDARVSVRFSQRDAVTPIWQDVRDGIIRNVSVGYRVYKFQETTGKEGEIPVRTAIDWEPFEVSMVPMGADAGAKVRSGDKSETYPCVLVRAEQENTPMDEETQQSETIVESNPLAPDTTTENRIELSQEPDERAEAAGLERERVQGILTACRAGQLPQSWADRFISDGTSLVKAQEAVFKEIIKRGHPDRGPAPGAGGVQITGQDPFVHVRAGIENALLHRVAPQYFKLEDVGRQYRGMTLLDVARVYLNGINVRTTSMSKMELAAVALGLSHRLGGMHSTSDFPILLADVANKTLRRAYDEFPITYGPLVRQTTVPDFKTVNRVQLGDAPALVRVLEHGEFTRGTISEGREQYAIGTWGRIFAVTRQALVNDDTDAFSRVPTMFGRSVRTLESNLVWTEITSNPTMGDGLSLFSAGHGNLTTPGTAISVDSLGIARAALRQQTSIDGQRLNITARYLLVPTGLETLADQFVTVITPNTVGSVNPFQGRLTVISEPRLDDASATAWYQAASTEQVDIIELATLEGEGGPMVESRIGFDVDGLEIKARHDVAAKVIDHRGLYRNDGA